MPKRTDLPVDDTGELLEGYMPERAFAYGINETIRNVRDRRRSGKGPPFLRIGNQVYIAKEDAKVWVQQQRVEPQKTS